MGDAIKITDLSHSFKEQLVLDNVSINFEKNKIYGLLGKNGSGKTTLLNIIANQLLSKSGYIEILGINIKDNVEVLDNICIVREKEFYNTEIKVKNIFKMYSYFYHNYDKELEKQLCDYFNINTKKRYQHLSRGMKSLVSNIIGLCTNAPITIFDEPTIGLDAVNREEFYNILLGNYIKNPRTIIISTHLIDEIDNVLENVILLDKGKIVINDNIENIKEKSYYITGKKEDLSKLECLNNKKIHKKFGSTLVYYYYGDICDRDLDLINKLDINVEHMSVQELFINTTKKGGFKYEKDKSIL
ncbi:ABC transporter ATP-binding protein [Clostridium sp. CCUG 7971]|uniref:ATP-binding cassette domain-containing protein n=1 Tax=Clostridium sp. CCUG 7971 TaxID=2811414 RepID=UPI001ABAF48E|nr:ABC transporter ATP-binding protein [Clostridium sp. CCUG 7971]